MTESKTTKRALAASIGCMALCVVLLIGTTFAWFTDTASTSVNKIQSGTLDVALVDGSDQALESLSFANNQGSTNILWEPGATFTTGEFYVKNNGSLALKYKLSIDGVDGDAGLLSAIDFSVVDSTGATVDLSTFEGNLTGKDTDGCKSGAYKIRAHMKESAGNEYQGQELDGIKVSVTATQDTVEYDSTSNQYDEKAEYATPVASVDELAAAIANGEDVLLTADVTLPGGGAIEVTGDVTIYGDGTHKLTAGSSSYGDDAGSGRVINVAGNTSPVTITLSGVDIVGPTENSYNRGINVIGNSDVTIVMDNCSASANHYAFNIASGNTKVNIVVRNTTLKGYSAFQTWSPNTTATFENCTLIGQNQWDNPQGSTSNNYFAIVAYEDATNSALTFKNCRIEANAEGSAFEYILGVGNGLTTVNFEGCEFYANGKALSVDVIGDYMATADGATINVS